MAQDAGAQVVLAAEEVEHLAGGRDRHRIDREVAPRRSLLRCHCRVGRGQEASVARADFALAARQREVELLAGGRAQLQHTEGAPDRVDPAERRQRHGQPLDIQVIDLDIEILRRVAQQDVAHRTADEQRQPAGGLDRVQNGLQLFQLIAHSGKYTALPARAPLDTPRRG